MQAMRLIRRLTAACTTAVLIAAALPVIPAQAAVTITVGKNGTYQTITEAVRAAAARKPSDENSRVTIAIEPGVYREQLQINTPYLTFTNSNPGGGEVLVTWYYGIGYQYYSAQNGYYDAAAAAAKSKKEIAQRWGTAVRLQSGAKYFRAENITFENSFNRYVTDEELADGVEPTGETLTVQRTKGMDVTAKSATERAAAMCVEADFCEFYRCEFLSSQDTLYTAAKAYFKECKIQGNTDYIFGSGDVVFDACELCFGGYSDNAAGGYITAAREQTLGYLFWECDVTANPGKKVGAGYFGRPWRDTAHVLFCNTALEYEGIIAPVGWTKMSGVEPEQATFREYGTKTASGGNVNTGSRTAGTVLSACDATREQYLNGWMPYYFDYEGGRIKTGAILDSSKRYYIRNVNSGLYLSADTETANITQGDKAAASLWYLEACGEGYYILYTDLESDRWRALEVAAGSTDNGTNIGIASGNANEAQIVKFVSAGDGAYEIVTRISGDASCIGVSGSSKDPGANIVAWECNGAADQRWILEEQILPLTGTLVQELYLYDREHAESWSLAENAQTNALMFGDRDVVLRNLPEPLQGAEMIRTACDSKYYGGTLATLVAAQPITVYAAMDTRVDPLPAWLSGWAQTALTFDNSGEVSFRCYAKTASAGEAVELGTNGQSANCVNYVVFAVQQPEMTTSAETTTQPETTETTVTETAPPEESDLRGDTDCNGTVDVSDAVLAARYLAEDPGARISEQGRRNSDCNNSDSLDSDDIILILRIIAHITE